MGAIPSLHEIAAMPFPASEEAVRKHYDPNWRRDVPEDGPRKFRVSCSWTISGDLNEVIEADSKEEARELLHEYVVDDAFSGYVELDSVKIEEVEE